MKTAHLINPFLHPDLVVHLEGDAGLVPHVVTVSNSYEIRGGAGAYTAAAMRRLGIDVYPVDRVGSDLFGEFTMGELLEMGCAVEHVARYEGRHFHVTSIVDELSLGETMLSCCPPEWQQPAAQIEQSVRDLPKADIGYVWSWFWSYANPHVSELDSLGLIQDLRSLVEILALDPNWKPSGTPPPKEVDALRQAAKYFDVLKLNLRDASVIVGEQAPKSTVESLLALGPAIVVLTMGAEGAILATEGKRHHVRIPAPKADARDSTGAGDVFGGTFVGRLSQTSEAESSACEASAVAALFVEGNPLLELPDEGLSRVLRQTREGCQIL